MDYTKKISRVDTMLKKFGASVTITSENVGVYNPATLKSPVTTIQQTSVGVILDWGTFGHPLFGAQFMPEGLISVKDSLLIMSLLNITPPKLADIVLFNGVKYTIVPPVKILSPAGIPVLFMANIRGM